MKFENIIESGISKNKNRPFEILDLGSGWIWSKLEFLFVNYKNQFHYTAVDKDTAYSIFHENLKEDNHFNELISHSDWITKLNHRLKYNEEYNGQSISEEEFNQSCKLQLEEDVITFIEKSINNKQYDLIILSNILHFIDRNQAAKIVNSCKSMLLRNGTIHITVLNDSQTRYERMNLYSKNDFDKMKSSLSVIEENINNLHFEFSARKE